MQLQLITEIFDFIKCEIESKQIIAKYESLLAIIRKIVNDPGKDYSEELGESRNSAIQALNETEPLNWSYSKYRLLQELDKDCIIGNRAVSALNDVFNSNQVNPSGMTKEITKMIENINKVLSADTGVLQILSHSSDGDESEGTFLTLFFEGRTSVNTIHDLERYSRIWDNIINDFSILTRQSNCESVIENIDKKSMTLRITDGDKILDSLSLGTAKIIDTYGKILRIRKLQLEVRKMSLNKNILDLLEDEITITINNASCDAVTELMAMNNRDNKEELSGNIQKSLKLILDFIEKGGKIECQLSIMANSITERNRKLLTAYRSVNEIEATMNEIKLFDSKSAESQMNS